MNHVDVFVRKIQSQEDYDKVKKSLPPSLALAFRSVTVCVCQAGGCIQPSIRAKLLLKQALPLKLRFSLEFLYLDLHFLNVTS